MNAARPPVRWSRRLLRWGAAIGLSAAGWVYFLRSREPAPDFHAAVADHFDAPQLSPLWTTDKFEPGAVELQSANVRGGTRAAKISVREGDRYEAADGHGGKVTERAELTERSDLYLREGQAAEYAFSIYLPPDFPIVPTRLVIAQWKQVNVARSVNDSPVLALRYVDGVFFVTLSVTPERTTLFSTRDELRGHWLDFVVTTRFSRRADGYVRMTMNGQSIVDFHGPTAYSEAQNYAAEGIFYFKMGLYRDRMAAPMTAYFDEYRKRPLPAGS